MESDTLYGDFMVKLVWRLSLASMEKHGKSDNLHINFTIKSP